MAVGACQTPPGAHSRGDVAGPQLATLPGNCQAAISAPSTGPGTRRRLADAQGRSVAAHAAPASTQHPEGEDPSGAPRSRSPGTSRGAARRKAAADQKAEEGWRQCRERAQLAKQKRVAEQEAEREEARQQEQHRQHLLRQLDARCRWQEHREPSKLFAHQPLSGATGAGRRPRESGREGESRTRAQARAPDVPLPSFARPARRETSTRKGSATNANATARRTRQRH